MVEDSTLIIYTLSLFSGISNSVLSVRISFCRVPSIVYIRILSPMAAPITLMPFAVGRIFISGERGERTALFPCLYITLSVELSVMAGVVYTFCASNWLVTSTPLNKTECIFHYCTPQSQTSDPMLLRQ